MAQKHRKKVLAIEWSWLFTGTAVVLVIMTEEWAAPYIPVIWMLGMVVFFILYRFAITLYEINWPEPELSVEEGAMAGEERVGGDGIVGTVTVALPQMRGRSVPQDRDQKRAEAGGKLALPGADGEFEDADLNTVFAYPTGELAEGEHEEGLRRKKVGRPGLFGVTVYEYEDLRPETDDDFTGTDLPIPSFAESQLTTLERAKALKLAAQDPGAPVMSAAVAAVVNRAKPAERRSVQQEGVFGVEVFNPEVLRDEFHPGDLRPETDDDMTSTDASIPAFAESNLTKKQRQQALEAIRGAEQPRAKTAKTSPQAPGQPATRPSGLQPPIKPAATVPARPALNSPAATEETKRRAVPDTPHSEEKTREHIPSLKERLDQQRASSPGPPRHMPPKTNSAQRSPRETTPPDRPAQPAILDELKLDELKQDALNRARENRRPGAPPPRAKGSSEKETP